jgi:ABC-2 type transport system ATP-binding protein
LRDAQVAPSDAIVRVKDLSKSYGGFAALSDASFSIRRDEILGIIGPNGSGKTTLMEILGGVLPADSGAVEISPDLGKPALFYLPDAITPWAEQTVSWALNFTIGFFGGRAPVRKAVIDRLDLGDFLEARISTLSKGQRKRSLLACGLLTPHPVLLADEPFDGLDLRQTREVTAYLKEIASAGRTLVVSIHQISEAARLCDRFVLLSDGRVRAEEAIPAERLEEVFLALT